MNTRWMGRIVGLVLLGAVCAQVQATSISRCRLPNAQQKYPECFPLDAKPLNDGRRSGNGPSGSYPLPGAAGSTGGNTGGSTGGSTGGNTGGGNGGDTGGGSDIGGGGTTGSRTQYGALAIDYNQGSAYGWAVNYTSQGQADGRALAECRGNCSVVLRFHNTCAAYSADQAGNSTAYGWAWNNSLASAQAEANRFCQNRGGRRCQLRVWGCTSR